MTHDKIHDSEYGQHPLNFHVAKHGDTLSVDLTYPPWTDADNKADQCRYVHVNQEAVRASDGVRLHYDYDRDGFVVEQPKPRLVALGKTSYGIVEDWTEVGFFQSWALNDWPECQPSAEAYKAADADFATPAPSDTSRLPRP